jgi:PST family polysaccharide transporter
LSAVVLGGANVLRLGAQLALLPILARLVGPAEYGLVALAMPFILFCNVVADGGLSRRWRAGRIPRRSWNPRCSGSPAASA